MKNNYPIKYANIPIFETKNNKTEVVYYITVKCYVISESKRFYLRGTEKTTYEAVPPYKLTESDVYNRQEPEFNKNNKCSNSYVVNALYDSIGEASKEKEEFNQDLYYSKYHMRSCDRKLLDIEFEARKNYYDQLQSEIDNYSDNLIIGLKNKPQESYHWYYGHARKQWFSIYDSMESYDDKYYSIRTIDYKDYINLEEADAHYKEVPKDLGKLLIANDPETRTKKVFLDEGYTYLKNEVLDDKIGDEITFVINPDNVFYTLEDSNDIIKSYEKSNHSFTLKRTK